MAAANASTAALVVCSLCSSLLAVINKYAITKFNYPGLLTGLQYLTSVLDVWVLGKLRVLRHDPFTLETAKKFLLAAFVFYLAIFTNTNNLLTLLMAPFFWVLTGEYAEVFVAGSAGPDGAESGWMRSDAFIAVSLSCVFGLLISFFGFAARKAISATAFTVTDVEDGELSIQR